MDFPKEYRTKSWVRKALLMGYSIFRSDAEEIRSWRDSILRNISTEEQVQEPEDILSDEKPGPTEALPAEALKKASKFVKYLDGASLAGMFWVMYYPRPRLPTGPQGDFGLEHPPLGKLLGAILGIHFIAGNRLRSADREGPEKVSNADRASVLVRHLWLRHPPRSQWHARPSCILTACSPDSRQACLFRKIPDPLPGACAWGTEGDRQGR